MSTIDKFNEAEAEAAQAGLTDEECAQLALAERRAGWPPDGKPKMIPGMGGVAILESTARMARFILYMTMGEQLISDDDVHRLAMIATRSWFGLPMEGLDDP